MTNEEIIETLLRSDLTQYQNVQDLFDMARTVDNYSIVKQVRDLSYKGVFGTDHQKDFYDLNMKTYQAGAKEHFEDYLIFLEWNREPKEKFYMPRRKIMSKVAEQLQKLEDDELDELFIQMCPRAGKSSIVMFFLTWILGKHPEQSNLYVAFSDTITRALYNGVMEVITDPITYNWSKVFPTATIADTNSKDETVNICRKKRYPSLTCRSLYGTLNGACDCNGYLISDDLLSGIEEALNPVRLDTAWFHVDNNMLTRAKSGAKKLWIGTMWSIADPISRRRDFLEENASKYKVRYYCLGLPALNEKDESNFDYDFGVGFDTNYYLQRRASFEKNNDMASWLAQYQQSPIERQGTLFEPAFMRYFNGELPSGEPDRIFMACDVAWGGGDFLSAPICYQYGADIYVVDVIFNNGDKYTTRPIVIEKILKHKVGTAQFEANNGGSEYCEYVEMELKKKGYRLNIRSVPAPTNKKKEARIFEKAPEIREMYFLSADKRDKEYAKFMQNVFAFTITGKKAVNDDSVDSLAMAIEVLNKSSYKPQAFKRPF